MSCGIKSPGCEPPFCLGTGGWCGCNCGCIPPCSVYTELTFKVPCGNWYQGETPAWDYLIEPCGMNYYAYCPPDEVFKPPVECGVTVDDPCAVASGGPCTGFDEYECTSGGWVKTYSGCTSPCRSNDPATYYTCNSESIGSRVEMDCTCPYTNVDFYDLTASFDGCGLYPQYENTCGKTTAFTVVGSGTITSSGPVTIYCNEGGESTIQLLFNGETSLEVVDCDTVTITIDWSGDPCCPCCLGGYYMKSTEAEYCGGTITDFCDTCVASIIAKRKKIRLKNSIMSRIKKVHYKP